MRLEPLADTQHGEARQALQRCLLFSALGKQAFEEILARTRRVTLGEGEVLFAQQQPATEIFLLQSGQIKLALLSPEGQEKVIDLILPGGTFAEAILFSGRHVYPVTATAVVRSDVWAIHARTYAAILHQSTDACFAVMTQMSRRLHWHIAEVDRLTLHNSAFRVVAYLLDKVGNSDQSPIVIKLDTPKHVIASRLSITPETLSRTFARLAREGYLEIEDNRVLIPDTERLRAYVKRGSF
jgi:CRP-like cAMP-binding protein